MTLAEKIAQAISKKFKEQVGLKFARDDDDDLEERIAPGVEAMRSMGADDELLEMLLPEAQKSPELAKILEQVTGGKGSLAPEAEEGPGDELAREDVPGRASGPPRPEWDDDHFRDVLSDEIQRALEETGQDMGNMTPEQVNEAMSDGDALNNVYHRLAEQGLMGELGSDETWEDFANALDASLEESHGHNREDAEEGPGDRSWDHPSEFPTGSTGMSNREESTMREERYAEEGPDEELSREDVSRQEHGRVADAVQARMDTGDDSSGMQTHEQMLMGAIEDLHDDPGSRKKESDLHGALDDYLEAEEFEVPDWSDGERLEDVNPDDPMLMELTEFLNDPGDVDMFQRTSEAFETRHPDYRTVGQGGGGEDLERALGAGEVQKLPHDEDLIEDEEGNQSYPDDEERDYTGENEDDYHPGDEIDWNSPEIKSILDGYTEDAAGRGELDDGGTVDGAALVDEFLIDADIVVATDEGELDQWYSNFVEGFDTALTGAKERWDADYAESRAARGEDDEELTQEDAATEQAAQEAMARGEAPDRSGGEATRAAMEEQHEYEQGPGDDDGPSLYEHSGGPEGDAWLEGKLTDFVRENSLEDSSYTEIQEELINQGEHLNLMEDMVAAGHIMGPDGKPLTVDEFDDLDERDYEAYQESIENDIFTAGEVVTRPDIFPEQAAARDELSAADVPGAGGDEIGVEERAAIDSDKAFTQMQISEDHLQGLMPEGGETSVYDKTEPDGGEEWQELQQAKQSYANARAAAGYDPLGGIGDRSEAPGGKEGIADREAEQQKRGRKPAQEQQKPTGKRKRCPKGSRKNPKTNQCEPYSGPKGGGGRRGGGKPQMRDGLAAYISNGIVQKFADLVNHKFGVPEYGSHEIDAYSEWEGEDNQAADDDIDHALNEYYEAVDSGRGVDEAKANASAALDRYQSNLTGESRNKAGNEPRYDDPEQVNDIVNAIGQAIQDPGGSRVSVDEAQRSSGTASDERGAAAKEAKKIEQDEQWANRPYAEDWRVEEAAAQIEAEKKGIVDEELEREMAPRTGPEQGGGTPRASLPEYGKDPGPPNPPARVDMPRDLDVKGQLAWKIADHLDRPESRDALDSMIASMSNMQREYGSQAEGDPIYEAAREINLSIGGTPNFDPDDTFPQSSLAAQEIAAKALDQYDDAPVPFDGVPWVDSLGFETDDGGLGSDAGPSTPGGPVGTAEGVEQVPKPSANVDRMGVSSMDFENYEKWAATLSDEELLANAKDAQEAIDAFPENPKAGYYQDEIHVAAGILHQRKQEAESTPQRKGKTTEVPFPKGQKRCKKGTRKNRKTGKCEPHSGNMQATWGEHGPYLAANISKKFQAMIEGILG